MFIMEDIEITIEAYKRLLKARYAIDPKISKFSIPLALSVDTYVSTYLYQSMRLLTDPIGQIQKIKSVGESYAKFPKSKKDFNHLIRCYFNIFSAAYKDYYHNITKLQPKTYRAVPKAELENILNNVPATVNTLCSVCMNKKSCVDYFINNKSLKHAIIVYQFDENIPHIRVNETLVNYKSDTLYSYGDENEIIITAPFEIVSIEQQQGSSSPPMYIAKARPLPIKKKTDISYTTLTQKYKKLVENISTYGEKVDDFLNKYKFNNPNDDPQFVELTDCLTDFIEGMQQLIIDRIEKGKDYPYRIPYDIITGERFVEPPVFDENVFFDSFNKYKEKELYGN